MGQVRELVLRVIGCRYMYKEGTLWGVRHSRSAEGLFGGKSSKGETAHGIGEGGYGKGRKACGSVGMGKVGQQLSDDSDNRKMGQRGPRVCWGCFLADLQRGSLAGKPAARGEQPQKTGGARLGEGCRRTGKEQVGAGRAHVLSGFAVGKIVVEVREGRRRGLCDMHHSRSIWKLLGGEGSRRRCGRERKNGCGWRGCSGVGGEGGRVGKLLSEGNVYMHFSQRGPRACWRCIIATLQRGCYQEGAAATDKELWEGRRVGSVKED